MSDAFEAGNIKGGIELDLATYARNIGIAIAESRRFESEFNGSMQKSQTLATAVGAAIGGVISAGISTAISAVGQLAASFVNAAISGVKLAADMEETTIAFEVMLGSADKAKALLKEISDFGASTPFEFPELAGASRKLLAYGQASETILPTLTRLGDISSALQIPLMELADLYGKARVNGTLYAEDINQLTGRGIPVIAEFAKQFGVAESQVKKLGSEGKITFANLEAAIVSMTSEGGRFEGITKRQSEGMKGLWSTASDAWSQTKREMGEAIAGGEDGKRFLVELTASLDEMRPAIVDLAQVAAEAIKNVLPLIKEGTELSTQLLAVLGQVDQYKNAKSPYQRDSVTAGFGTLGADAGGIESAIRVGGGTVDTANVLGKAFESYRQTPQVSAALAVSAPGLLDRQAEISRQIDQRKDGFNTAFADLGKMLQDQRAGIAVDPERFEKAKAEVAAMTDLVDQLREAQSQVAAAVSASNLVTSDAIKGEVAAVQDGVRTINAESDKVRGRIGNAARDAKRAALEAARGTEAEAFLDSAGNPIAGDKPVAAGSAAPTGSPATPATGKENAGSAAKPEKDPRADWAAESVDARLRAAGKMQELEELELKRWKDKEAEKAKTVEERQALEEAYAAKLGEVQAKFQERDRAESQKTADKAAADAQRAAEEQTRAAQRAADEAERIARQEQDRLAAMAGGFADLRGADRKAAYEALAGMQTDTTAYTRPLQQQIAATAPAIAPAAVGGSVAAQIQQALPDIAAKVAVAVQGQTNAAGTQQTAALQPIVESIRTTLVKTDTALAATLDLVRQIELRARRGAIAFKEATI